MAAARPAVAPAASCPPARRSGARAVWGHGPPTREHRLPHVVCAVLHAAGDAARRVEVAVRRYHHLLRQARLVLQAVDVLGVAPGREQGQGRRGRARELELRAGDGGGGGDAGAVRRPAAPSSALQRRPAPVPAPTAATAARAAAATAPAPPPARARARPGAGGPPAQQLLPVQQRHEAVGGRGRVVAGEQLLGQHVEGLGVPPEVVDAEDGLWGGQLEARQLRVEACRGGRRQECAGGLLLLQRRRRPGSAGASLPAPGAGAGWRRRGRRLGAHRCRASGSPECLR
jgi:hypothetical protein